MKLATFETGGLQRVGLVDTGRGEILDLLVASNDTWFFRDMITLIEAGEAALENARTLQASWPRAAVRGLSDVIILSPLPRPVQLRDCLVFEEHLRNSTAQWAKMTDKPAAPISEVWYRRPTWYKGNRMSVIGTGRDVIWPSYAKLMDYELELACVVGKQGRDIAAHDAMDHILGLTIFNDFSARDLQIVERPLGMGPMKSKDFDTGNVLGPWITTIDEFRDPHSLEMTVRVNGERSGGGNSRDMHHKFPEILAFVSQSETLYPGEVIASGTVGTGCGLETGRWLEPGDVVELEIEGIGILRNRIVRYATDGQ